MSDNPIGEFEEQPWGVQGFGAVVGTKEEGKDVGLQVLSSYRQILFQQGSYRTWFSGRVGGVY